MHLEDMETVHTALRRALASTDAIVLQERLRIALRIMEIEIDERIDEIDAEDELREAAQGAWCVFDADTDQWVPTTVLPITGGSE